MIARLRAGLAARAARIGAAAVADAAADVATQIAEAAPEIDVTIGDAEVQLSARALVARLFGSRKRGPDLRLRVTTRRRK